MTKDKKVMTLLGPVTDGIHDAGWRKDDPEFPDKLVYSFSISKIEEGKPVFLVWKIVWNGYTYDIYGPLGKTGYNPRNWTEVVGVRNQIVRMILPPIKPLPS